MIIIKRFRVYAVLTDFVYIAGGTELQNQKSIETSQTTNKMTNLTLLGTRNDINILDLNSGLCGQNCQILNSLRIQD